MLLRPDEENDSMCSFSLIFPFVQPSFLLKILTSFTVPAHHPVCRPAGIVFPQPHRRTPGAFQSISVLSLRCVCSWCETGSNQSNESDGRFSGSNVNMSNS